MKPCQKCSSSTFVFFITQIIVKRWKLHCPSDANNRLWAQRNLEPVGCKLTLPKKSAIVKSTRERKNCFPMLMYCTGTSNSIFEYRNFVTVLEEGNWIKAWIVVCAEGLLPVPATIPEFGLRVSHSRYIQFPSHLLSQLYYKQLIYTARSAKNILINHQVQISQEKNHQTRH